MPLTYREVAGLWSARVPDGPDSDQYPDTVLLEGHVTFEPQYRVPLVYPGEHIVIEPMRAVIHEGVLYGETVVGDDVVRGPLFLPVTVDEDANQSWSWVAKFQGMRLGEYGEDVTLPNVRFQVPPGGDALDLSAVFPVSQSGGTITVRGPAGPGLTDILAENGQLTMLWDDGGSRTITVPDAVPGPAPNLTIGTVSPGKSPGDAAATITGAAPNYDLNLVLPVASPDEATPATAGLMPAADKAQLDQATAAPAPDTLVRRSESGEFAGTQIEAMAPEPTEPQHLTRRDWVEGLASAPVSDDRLPDWLQHSTNVAIERWGAPKGERVKIPTYVEGADGQTTHPSIVHVPAGWNGYRYWLAHTPYPGSNDAYENPSIAVSNDGANWSVPDGLTNPIDEQQGSANGGIYNSDTDLTLVNGVMHLVWRTRDNISTTLGEQIYLSTSTDGVTWTPKQLIISGPRQDRTFLSPSLVHERDGSVTCYFVDMVPATNQVMRMTAPTPEGPWSTPTAVTVSPLIPGKEPWHLEVIYAYGQHWMLLNDGKPGTSGHAGDLMLAVSSDGGETFRGAGRPVVGRLSDAYESRWSYNTIYRSTMVPAIVDGAAGFDLWYAARDQRSPASTSTWYVYRTGVRVDGLDTGSQRIALAADYAPGVSVSDPSVPTWRVARETVYIEGSVRLASGGNIATGYKPIGADPGVADWALPRGPHRGPVFTYVGGTGFYGFVLTEAGQPLKIATQGATPPYIGFADTWRI